MDGYTEPVIIEFGKDYEIRLVDNPLIHRIIPTVIMFQSTMQFHEPQFILWAHDYSKNAHRGFAMIDINYIKKL